MIMLKNVTICNIINENVYQPLSTFLYYAIDNRK